MAQRGRSRVRGVAPKAMRTLGVVVFASKGEMERYCALVLMEKAGMIRHLDRQREFVLEVNGVKVCSYVADFVYEENWEDGWRGVVEDYKGMATEVYKLKKKLMWACHSVKIRETHYEDIHPRGRRPRRRRAA